MPTRICVLRTCCLLTSMMLLASQNASAGHPFNVISFLKGKSTDLKPHSCETCGHSHGKDEYCISRQKVEECVVGKKKVYKTKIRYEWVSIPETRYMWKNQLITEDVSCPYCKPICKTEDCERCVGREKWEKYGDKNNELHCRSIEPILEKGETKHCEHEAGETTVRVKYWSCIKVPYTVYRQVKQPVCVKQPRYVTATVSVTKYVCGHCCDQGCNSCGHPNTASNDDSNSDLDSDSNSDGSEEIPAPTDENAAEEVESAALYAPVISGEAFLRESYLGKSAG